MKSQQQISIYCDICKTEIMMPVEMPKTKNEVIKLLKEVYNYNKPLLMTKKLFVKSILSGYIRFKCPHCSYEKLTQLSELIIQGFIDANTCKKCDSDVCLWVNCKNGGYLR